VASAVDATVVVMMPQLGDEIQAFKAGFNEIGDIFVVNKSDIANPAKTIYNIATGIQEKQGWRPMVIKTVAIKNTGISQLVDALEKFREYVQNNGLTEKRRRQHLEEELLDASFSDFHVEMLSRLKRDKAWIQIVKQVVNKQLDPETAASKLARTIGKLEVSS
jgi:LAO/AO transport system kinase